MRHLSRKQKVKIPKAARKQKVKILRFLTFFLLLLPSGSSTLLN